jgi:hypothetical protein
VTIDGDKNWSVVDGLSISDFAQKMLDITGQVKQIYIRISVFLRPYLERMNLFSINCKVAELNLLGPG